MIKNQMEMELTTVQYRAYWVGNVKVGRLSKMRP